MKCWLNVYSSHVLLLMLCKCVRRLQLRLAPSFHSISAGKHPARSNRVLRQPRRSQTRISAATKFDAMNKVAYDFEVFGKVTDPNTNTRHADYLKTAIQYHSG